MKRLFIFLTAFLLILPMTSCEFLGLFASDAEDLLLEGTLWRLKTFDDQSGSVDATEESDYGDIDSDGENESIIIKKYIYMENGNYTMGAELTMVDPGSTTGSAKATLEDAGYVFDTIVKTQEGIYTLNNSVLTMDGFETYEYRFENSSLIMWSEAELEGSTSVVDNTYTAAELLAAPIWEP